MKYVIRKVFLSEVYKTKPVTEVGCLKEVDKKIGVISIIITTLAHYLHVCILHQQKCICFNLVVMLFYFFLFYPLYCLLSH